MNMKAVFTIFLLFNLMLIEKTVFETVIGLRQDVNNNLPRSLSFPLCLVVTKYEGRVFPGTLQFSDM